MDYVAVYIVAKDVSEARRIGKALVKERLVGCVNIIPHIESLYWWEGKLEEGQEVLLVGKTKHKLSGEVVKRVKELHSYSVPCITILPIISGDTDYFSWLSKETR